MIRISELASTLARGEIDVCGRKVEVRAVSYRETVRASALWPSPKPPVKHNAVLKEDIADEQDPGYLEAKKERAIELDVIEAAIAIENQTKDGLAYDQAMSAEDFRAWARASIAEIGVLHFAEVWAILQKSRALRGGDDALGN